MVVVVVVVLVIVVVVGDVTNKHTYIHGKM